MAAIRARALNDGQFENASLYVGDLDRYVNETQLFELFSQVAQVISVRVCRDQIKGCSLGYAYVNLSDVHEAVNAIEQLNFTPLNGRSIRIMFSNRDPSIRRSGHANVFVKNLDASIDNKTLHETFAAFGSVLSCKVAVDDHGHSKGYGFVQFDNDESAQNAINKLNGMLINDKKIYVGLFIRRQERGQADYGSSSRFTNVYVKNFSETFTDEDLRQLFSTYGTITSAVVMKDTDGKSRCFGFVNFESPDSAATAVSSLNGTTVDGEMVLYVGRAQRKAERVAELTAMFENERIRRYEKRANLYVKNLDDNVNDEKLIELFSEFGTITSCKLMVGSNGQSKGYGFVAFSTPEDASRALNEMNGKMIGRKPLYVAVAQRREERKALLQSQFSQMVRGLIRHLPAGMSGYHMGTPIFAPQQLYFGQGVSPQPTGYGYGFQQQQPFQGMYPNVAPNYLMPYHMEPYQYHMEQQGFPYQHLLPNNMRHNSNQFRYMGNGRNGMDYGSGISTAPVDNQRPNTLASALSSATPENQRRMLGDHLYPLVEALTPSDQTAKVTGMLLEMDQAEVIHLIESPEEMKTKVSEAMKLLSEAASGSKVGDQPAEGSLSLNE